MKKVWYGLLVVGALALSAYFFIVPRYYGISPYRQEDDLGAVMRILYNDWWTLVADNPLDFDAHYTFTHRAVDPSHADGSLNIFVYRMHGKPVAFATYYRKQGCEAHIQFVAVDKNYRKRGYARAMLDYIMKDALAHGVCVVTLLTRITNIPAQTLYRSYGFTQTWKTEGFVGFQKVLLPGTITSLA